MFKQLRQFWIPICALFAFSAACAILFFYTDSADIKNLSLSLGTCFFSALIVIAVMDLYLSALNEKIKSDTIDACLRSLRPATCRVSSVVFNMIKATAESSKSEEQTSITELLASVDINKIQKLNLSFEAPVIPTMTWTAYISSAFLEYSEKIERFSEKYSVHLDPTTIDLCEKISNHLFIGSCRNGLNPPNVPGLTAPHLFSIAFSTQHGESYFMSFIKLTKELSKKIEMAAPSEELVIGTPWSDNVAPLIGSALTARR